jgi:predicted dehydrogenase
VVRKIRIFQEDSYISLDYVNQEVTLFKKTGNKVKKEKVKIKKAQPLDDELQSFIECLRTGKKPIVSGVEGRRALAVALDILEKIKTNKQ